LPQRRREASSRRSHGVVDPLAHLLPRNRNRKQTGSATASMCNPFRSDRQTYAHHIAFFFSMIWQYSEPLRMGERSATLTPG
jgi:hypothetical protein